MFNPNSKIDIKSEVSAAPKNEIGDTFQPEKGTYFRTQEFAEKNEQGDITGKVWMEAGRVPNTDHWVLWQKSIRQIDDVLTGKVESVMSSKALFEKTSFAKAFDQMVTFEKSMDALQAEAMTTKTPAKLGGDYFRQFAWRENLMMSRSGRLYPVSEDQVNSANYFDANDLIKAKEFLERLAMEKFVPVPIVLPAVDWEKTYAVRKDLTDKRLNALYHRFGDDKNNFDLALQIVGQEVPEVLYAHIKRGFNPKIFEPNSQQHYALLAAAIERTSVECLQLLADAGIHFDVRHNDKTPIELAIDSRNYSHLYVMISRDGAKLANYADNDGHSPAVHAIKMQDRQAFRMLYLEGLDYDKADNKGYYLVHHAFENNFVSGVYAWIDEQLSIDYPIKDGSITGLSIARHLGHQTLVEFAIKNGANPNAPVIATPATTAQEPKKTETNALPFTLDLLNSATTNAEIEKSARAHIESGGDLNMVDQKGLSLLEICWKNSKPNPDLNRRSLIKSLGEMGADPSAQLQDGTTVLTRIVSGMTLDGEFLKAVAPYVKDVNAGDANGNNILHALQLNKSETVGHSSNVATVLKLFPTIDPNRQNADGYSNVGLAVRLNRSQTLKAFSQTLMVDWSQVTGMGWSSLDLAFTKACALTKVAGAPRADKIAVTSDATRTVVLEMAEKTARTGTQDDKDALSAALERQRPDGKTVLEAMTEEQANPATLTRLAACKTQPIKPASASPKMPKL